MKKFGLSVHVESENEVVNKYIWENIDAALVSKKVIIRNNGKLLMTRTV